MTAPTFEVDDTEAPADYQLRECAGSETCNALIPAPFHYCTDCQAVVDEVPS